MQCTTCEKTAIFTNPTLCKEHFLSYFEQKVEHTIKEFSLVTPDQKVAVAVSGGKDSLTVLFLLKKFGYRVEGICIDEGIQGYRNKTLEELETFCTTHAIPLKVVSFEDEFSTTMDEVVAKDKQKTPCHNCGILRRYTLNKAAGDYDVIATGHNADDEAQVIFMNFLHGSLQLSARLGPISGVGAQKGFTQRVKPLYRCTEKEVMTYAYLQGFASKYAECPYAPQSFRFKIRDLLNDFELENPGAKLRLIEWFLDKLPSLQQQFSNAQQVLQCTKCGEPSSGEICNACKLRSSLSENLKTA